MPDAGAARTRRIREVKIVLLGDSGVGKSSLAQRFVSNSFKAFSESTIGASFLSKMMVVDGKPVKLQIWDTAGQEKYHSLAPMYYRGAAAAVLVYDRTQPASFARLKDWVRELQDQGPDNLLLSMAANKSDLDHGAPTEAARQFADEIGAAFVETSAKEDENVTELFTELARRLPPPDRQPRNAGMTIGANATPAKASGCCSS